MPRTQTVAMPVCPRSQLQALEQTTPHTDGMCVLSAEQETPAKCTTCDTAEPPALPCGFKIAIQDSKTRLNENIKTKTIIKKMTIKAYKHVNKQTGVTLLPSLTSWMSLSADVGTYRTSTGCILPGTRISGAPSKNLRKEQKKSRRNNRGREGEGTREDRDRERCFSFDTITKTSPILSPDGVDFCIGLNTPSAVIT